MTRKSGGVGLQWMHTDTAKQRKQREMEITRKQHNYIMQHLRRIMEIQDKSNNLTREQLACIYHIMVTMVDIIDPSHRERIKKALAECK